MVATPRVEVVLPCLDEAAALPGLLASMPPGMRPLVVDNGSTDGSGAIAASLGARVVEESARGYGAACHAGLLAARAPVVAFMDADGSLDPGDLPSVCAPVLDDHADLVVGARRAVPGAFPLRLRVANGVLAARIRRRTGLALHDIGPMRAGRREALVALGLTDRRSGYPVETVVAAADAGLRVVGVPVTYLPRTGTSKVTGTARGALRAVRDMSAVLRR